MWKSAKINLEDTENNNYPCCCDAWTETKHEYACWMCDNPQGRKTKSEGKKGGHKPVQLTIKFKEHESNLVNSNNVYRH